MSKRDDLRKLYSRIELDTPAERELLAKVRRGEASDEEHNELLDAVSEYKSGAQLLDEIMQFETDLVRDFGNHVDALERMEQESTDVAHLEDEEVKAKAYAAMKIRYQDHVEQAEENLEAMKEAYFQVASYDQEENRLYKTKEDLAHLA